ncbi:hypothetical protein RB195_012211 [Necator americanus]|uniref:DUF7083 domain-containing protein n=1 Tax=Necator americanus TaxID=51031 RepID=A0ABR1D7Z1_NECAM
MFGTVARFWFSFGRKKTEQQPIEDSEERRPNSSRSRIQKKEDRTAADRGFRRKKTEQQPIEDSEERRPNSSRSRIQKKEDRTAADRGFRRKKTEQQPIEDPEIPRGAEGKASESQLENFLAAIFEQMRIQHEEMKTLLTALAPTQRTTVQEVSKDQYDQLSEDVQMFVSDEEVGHTFAYWYKRYGPVIRDSVLLDSKKCNSILMKLDEDAYRKYANDILQKQPHKIDFETTVANLEKLFASRKTLIR